MNKPMPTNYVPEFINLKAVNDPAVVKLLSGKTANERYYIVRAITHATVDMIVAANTPKR